MNVRDTITESILECSYLGITSEDIKDDTRMIDDLGFDSIIYIQVIVTIEEKLNISLSNDILEIDDIIYFSDFYKKILQSMETI